MQENTNVFHCTKMRILHTLTLREIYVTLLQQQSRDTDFGYVSPDFRAPFLWERSIKSNLSTSSLGGRAEEGTMQRQALVVSRVTQVSNEPRVLVLNGVPQLPHGASRSAKKHGTHDCVGGLSERQVQLYRARTHAAALHSHLDTLRSQQQDCGHKQKRSAETDSSKRIHRVCCGLPCYTRFKTCQCQLEPARDLEDIAEYCSHFLERDASAMNGSRLEVRTNRSLRS